jgi:hypothetical protein
VSDGGQILGFLARARRRYLLRALLVAAAVSAVANLAVGYLIDGLNRIFELDLPSVSVGLALFIVLCIAALRNNRAARVAARADRQLKLQDRLASFLDFAVRQDVDRGFLGAQAEETAAALGQVDLRRGIPVPLLLWAGPLAFGVMLYASYFAYFSPPGSRISGPRGKVAYQRRATVVDDQRPAEPGRVGPAPAGDAAQQGKQPVPDGAPTAAEPSPASPGATAPPPSTPPEGSVAGGKDAAPSPGGGSPAIIPEPARLFSEQVGRSLTPVVDAGSALRERPGATDAALPLRGRISFNLVPADGKPGGPAADGGTGGGKAESLEITIDYDAIPPQYHGQVRRYFELLARLFKGGSLGT